MPNEVVQANLCCQNALLTVGQEEIRVGSEGRRVGKENLISASPDSQPVLNQTSGDDVWQTNTWEHSPCMRDSSYSGNENLPMHVVISHHEWHLRHGDLLQFKKFAMLAAPGRTLFWGIFFNTSRSEPFTFQFSFEPKGCVIRGLLQTFARGTFSPVPWPCASKTLGLFQALPEIARAVKSLFNYQSERWWWHGSR